MKKIEFEGRTWDLDTDDLDVRQAMVLHMTYGMTIKAWSDGFQQMDARSYHFAYWLMLQQNGERKPIAETNPKIIDFMSAYADAAQAEAAEAKAAKAAEEAQAAAQPQAAPFPPAAPPSGEPLAAAAAQLPQSPPVPTAF